MAKHNAIKLEMIDKIPEVATTLGMQYTENGVVAERVRSAEQVED
tara:strand:- start:6578 stop:6712 length:135 start_codon:yes stop_codon:yes gene_type:complete